MQVQQALWQQLKEQELVTGEYEQPEQVSAPWFVKLLLAFSGWFASLFLLAFFLITMSDLINNTAFCIIPGTVLIVVAYFLLKGNPHEFIEHLMLASSLAGQALIAVVLFSNELLSSALATWLVILIIQSLLAALMPHYVHRVCSAFFASIAFVVSCHYLNISMIASACLLFLIIILVLHEWRFPKWHKATEAVSYGVLLLLIPLKASTNLGYHLSFWLAEQRDAQVATQYFDELLLMLAMVYLVIVLIRRSEHIFTLNNRIAIITATACFCLLSIYASGITVGLAILVLGFSNSNKILQGLGSASLLYYIASYYYLLELTLLEKAGTLLVVGCFLLLIRHFLLKQLNPLKKGVAHDA